MNVDINNLSHRDQEIERLTQLLKSKDQVIKNKDQVIKRNAAEILKMERFISILKKLAFGPRTERRTIPEGQLEIEKLFEDVTAAAHDVIDDMDKELRKIERSVKKTKKKPRRRKLPEHLPRERRVYAPDKSKLWCDCCGAALKKIREEVSERLDVVPLLFRAIEEVKEIYGCPKCKGAIKSATAPPAAIERGIPTEGLLAHIITEKYDFHMPLERLSRKFEHMGVSVNSSTMIGWLKRTADLLEPVIKHMERDLLQCPVINADETPITVLTKGKNKKGKHTRKGFMWFFQGGKDVALYRYTPTRHAYHVQQMLAKYKGTVQCDAYSGYDALFEQEGVEEANCWQHVKRKFIDTMSSDRPRCEHAVNAINMLYRIEHVADERKLKPAARLLLRQELSAKLLGAFEQWLRTAAEEVLPDTPIEKTILYPLNHWDGLTRFLKDGRVKLDNNYAELGERHVAVGRKNWMFAGSEEGARRSAIFFSLVYNCRLLRINPFEYIKDVLEKIANLHPHSRIGELTPSGWLKARNGVPPAKPTLDTS